VHGIVLIWPQVPECTRRPHAGTAVNQLLKCPMSLTHTQQKSASWILLQWISRKLYWHILKHLCTVYTG